MKRARLIVLSSMAGSIVFVLACNSAPAGNDAATDSSAGPDSAEDVGGGYDTGGQDAGGQDSAGESSATDSGGLETAGDAPATEAGPVNDCTAFIDLTSGDAVITGPTSSSAAQFSPNCVHIKAGQSVTWNVAFKSHPLAPFGGATPNPIQPTSTGATVTFAFPNPGIYGFHCSYHPTMMYGVVEVTP